MFKFGPRSKKEKIDDKYESLKSIYTAFNKSGIDTISLIYGIDMTGSNVRSGMDSFNGLPLHTVREGHLNFYEQIITLLGQTLEKYDSDKSIPTYYFGCSETRDEYVGELSVNNRGYEDVLVAYRHMLNFIVMDGPTSFAPLIDKAIEIVRETNKYHLLVILCDGEISGNCKKKTDIAIAEASKYPLSIVIIGIGDGPWDGMELLDDNVKGKKYDNVQFVCANKFLKVSDNTNRDMEDPEVVKARQDSFLIEVLQEIPQQYSTINKLGLFKNCGKSTKYNYRHKVISHAELQTLTNRNSIDDDNLCPVCLERPKNACIHPCGHLICYGRKCHQSIQQNGSCPICRGQVNNITRIYN